MTGQSMARASIEVALFGFFFVLLFCWGGHTSTFQLLDKPWSQVSSLLPPVLAFNFYRA